MYTERSFDPLDMGNKGNGIKFSLPVRFLQEISAATSLQDVLDVVSEWIYDLFDASRASITLQDGPEFLKLYSIFGNRIIPIDYAVPIDGTLVGRAYLQRKLIICDDISQSNELDCILLAKSGLGSCMDAPLISGDTCFGTLNVAHNKIYHYTEQNAVELQCLANWISLNIQLRMQVTELNKLAFVDHLTGISNRRAFTQCIQENIRQYHAEEHVFYLALLDVDHFKSLNDKYGHNTGDDVLKQIATITSNLLDESSNMFRIGGRSLLLLWSEIMKNQQLNYLIT